jgi:hypothetical protein
MTVIQFPKTIERKRGPVPIFVCAPSYADMVHAKKKFGLGYSREEATARFYEGGGSQEIETRVFTLATAPGWLRFHIVQQLQLHLLRGQPLSPVDEETRARLGDDPYAHGKGPRKPKR